MKILKVEILKAKQKEGIVTLWNEEYPEQLQYKGIGDFDLYLQDLEKPKHYLLTDPKGALKGWAFTFDRDNERWFAIIIDSTEQSKGYGSKLLSELKKDNRSLNGWVTDTEGYLKSNGTPYVSPLPFYLKNGFDVLEDVRLQATELSAVKIFLKK